MLFERDHHIVSASRRTDIPAFYAEWFAQRIREGYCRVANPFNPSKIREVSLRPEDVAAVVFWTRNTRPLRPFLAEMDDRGYNYYFLYTITGYPKHYEPGMPSSDECIDEFLTLAGRIGPEKVIWRYDPVVLTPELDTDYHRRNFTKLSRRLSEGTKSVVINFVKMYRHNRAALSDCGYTEPSASESDILVSMFAETASSAGVVIQSCGRRECGTGIEEGKCIDEKRLRDLFGLELQARKDPGQSKECRCIGSVDIGRYGTCCHGCRYCYASGRTPRATRRYAMHNCSNEML